MLPTAFLCSPLIQANQIDVSPPNWWAGMKSPHVELMLYGEGIAHSKVRIDESEANGVEIEKVTSLDSDNYLFVKLNTQHATAGDIVLHISNSDGLDTSVTYSLLKRKTDSAQRQGFTSHDAIYLITPDRFANGDSSNDTVTGYVDTYNPKDKGGRHGGDLAGIIEHLSYVEEMGFSQIWTMPLLENAMDTYSYHGYSTTDYYKIDPRFGSNDQFLALSEKAGEKGIGIIMDMVLNHIGSNHPWMEDLPAKDWVNHNGNFVGTTHRRESLHDPHAVDSDKRGFSDGWFVPTMPDLNQRNPHLATYLIQNALWWVEYADLSGIRVDTYSYSDKAFLSQWTQRVMEEYPNFNIVGEEWSVNPAITAYWQAGSQRHDNYISALPSVMDFPLQSALIKGLNSDESWNGGFLSIYEILATDFLYADPNNLVVFADNHDMSRLLTQVNGDIDKWNMAITLILTTRGIPQVFYGTEVLMDNPNSTDHGIIRSDFADGWPAQSGKNYFTGEGLNKKESWAQNRVKTLLKLRKQHPNFFHGDLKHYAPVNGVYTYFRVSDTPEEGMLMVVLNKAEQDLSLKQYEALLGQYHKVTRVSDGAGFEIDDTLSLPAMSATVFVVQ
ncbi:glycoside hydrolase family 13 protein [Alteromonas sp. D210916BOD_24]|uniref:glycoside hydrolase family 13 protein n=1 Tax=Alteromonas sp. D210916BOD_24 TaxID=3157618 RepID=UPI00399D42B4